MPSRPISQSPRTRPTCCTRSALNAEATYCDDCGKPLVRCMSFEECGGLLDDNGLCHTCVTPHMQIEAGALIEAKVGGAVALPVSITNGSRVGRPLFVTQIWSREGTGDWREERLSWEKLMAGEKRPVTITADRLNHSGVHNIEILVCVATRWRWRQECYAFSTNFALEVEGEAGKAGPVVNIGGESAGHGNTVYISGQAQTERTQKTRQAIDMVLVRAEKEERKLKLRGLDEGLWVPRNAKICWNGFSENQAPMDGPILRQDGILAAGRSRTRAEGGGGDIRLLVQDQQGAVDLEQSRLLSRRHFELYIECDRLVLRVTGRSGLRINGEAYGPDKTLTLNNGDIIEPLTSAPKALALKTRFHSEYGRVSTIEFSRITS